MSRKVKSAAAIGIVALAVVFRLGQDQYGDASETEPQIAPSLAIATLDVAKVFEKSQKFNAAIAPIRAKLDSFDTGRIKNKEVRIHYKKETFAAERELYEELYAETYQTMNEAVTRICQARNIGLVIRATRNSIDVADRASVLQGVNKQIVYSSVPDITEEVIAELNR